MQFNVLTDPTDLERFERAKRLGFHCVEPDLSVDDLNDPDAARLISLKEARMKTGLEIASLCLGAALPVKAGAAECDAAIARILRAVELDAKVLLLAFFFSNSVETGYDSWLVFEVPPGIDDDIRADIGTARKFSEISA